MDGQRTRSERSWALGAAAGSVGAATAALLAAACCLGPLLVSLVGVGGAVAAAGLAPYRPTLLALAVVSTGLGLWLWRRAPGVEGARCPTRAGRLAGPALFGAAALTSLSILLPYLVEGP